MVTGAADDERISSVRTPGEAVSKERVSHIILRARDRVLRSYALVHACV